MLSLSLLYLLTVLYVKSFISFLNDKGKEMDSFSDVLDLAWSPDDRFLASGSVDNTVHMWNAEKFPGKLLPNSSFCLLG